MKKFVSFMIMSSLLFLATSSLANSFNAFKNGEEIAIKTWSDFFAQHPKIEIKDKKAQNTYYIISSIDYQGVFEISNTAEPGGYSVAKFYLTRLILNQELDQNIYDDTLLNLLHVEFKSGKEANYVLNSKEIAFSDFSGTVLSYGEKGATNAIEIFLDDSESILAMRYFSHFGLVNDQLFCSNEKFAKKYQTLAKMRSLKISYN